MEATRKHAGRQGAHRYEWNAQLHECADRSQDALRADGSKPRHVLGRLDRDAARCVRMVFAKIEAGTSVIEFNKLGGKHDGAVYFLQSGKGGPIKIGCAKDFAKRLRMLQIGNPVELKLLRTLDGGARREHRLHEQFKECNIRGEWFQPEPILAWLATLSTADVHHARHCSSHAAAELGDPITLTPDGLATVLDDLSFLEKRLLAYRAGVSWRSLYRWGTGGTINKAKLRRLKWAISGDWRSKLDRFDDQPYNETFSS